MKATLRIIRLPRKIVFIIGGILLLGGATGAFALYIGKDRLLGRSAAFNNGFECTTVKTFKIKKKDSYWVRKFIKMAPADGMTRVRTALRVAKAVYDAQKPDLVQVVVLDRNGPEQRAEMRGRAVGADVVYVPDPQKLEDLSESPVYTAKYVDGTANETGHFYGEKIQVPLEAAERLVATLNDTADCSEPKTENAAKEADGGKKDAAKDSGAGHEKS